MAETVHGHGVRKWRVLAKQITNSSNSNESHYFSMPADS